MTTYQSALTPRTALRAEPSGPIAGGFFLDGTVHLSREDAEALRDQLTEFLAPRPRISAGDRVYWNPSDLPGDDRRKRVYAGTVESISRHPGDVRVRFDNPEIGLLTYAASDLDLLDEPAPTTKFSVGDRVFWHDAESVRESSISRDRDLYKGTVVSLTASTVRVKFDRWTDPQTHPAHLIHALTPDPDPAVEGVEVWVTGDTDEWGHGIAPGTLVRIVADDVLEDGSYYVAYGPDGENENYVGANDLTIHAPRLVFHGGMCDMCRP